MTRGTLLSALLVSLWLPACAALDGEGQAPVSSALAEQTPASAQPACQPGDQRGCEIDGDIPGKQSCGIDPEGVVRWGACEALPCEIGEVVGCTTESQDSGLRQCEGEGAWGACGTVGNCSPGATMKCQEIPGFPGTGGGAACALENGEWRFPAWACATPLVISFDRSPVRFTRASGSFDVHGAGLCAATDWVDAGTPWLALDRDGNGQIDDGSELFGSMTALPGGQRARQGFEALAPLDSNGDGWISAQDEAWSRLVLWRDQNQDRRSQPRELRGLEGEGVLAIELKFRVVGRCEAGGSCEGERARILWRDGDGNERRGAVVDVHLADR